MNKRYTFYRYAKPVAGIAALAFIWWAFHVQDVKVAEGPCEKAAWDRYVKQDDALNAEMDMAYKQRTTQVPLILRQRRLIEGYCGEVSQCAAASNGQTDQDKIEIISDTFGECLEMK